MKKLSSQLPHYASLVGLLAITLIGFSLFSYDKQFQFALVSSVCVGYFLWGTIHHHIHKDLTLGVFIEYLLVSTLGFIVMISLITRV